MARDFDNTRDFDGVVNFDGTQGFPDVVGTYQEDFASPASDGDPFFTSVVFLAGFDGADAAQAFVSEDSGLRTATFVSSAQLDTAKLKFGSAALLVDGTDDYVSFPDSADFDLGSGDFTIEAFVRLSAKSTSYQGIVGKWGDGTDRSYGFYYTSGDKWAFYYSTDGSNSPGFEIASSPALTLDTWYHAAVTRQGTLLKFWLDGVQQGASQTIGTDTFNSSAATLKIGRASNGEFFAGSLDEVRVTRGEARYKNPFNPPTAAFPRQAA